MNDCILNGDIPIFTKQGWKKIRNIEIGDLVLTHQLRFRKVIQVFKGGEFKNYAIKLKVKNRQFNNTRTRFDLIVTKNHLILTKSGIWKEAKDLKDKDRILLLVKKCNKCNDLIFDSKFFCNDCEKAILSFDSTFYVKKYWENPRQEDEGEFKFLAVSVTKIEEWERLCRRKKYNFEVEEDNSYIANNIMVHGI